MRAASRRGDERTMGRTRRNINLIILKIILHEKEITKQIKRDSRAREGKREREAITRKWAKGTNHISRPLCATKKKKKKKERDQCKDTVGQCGNSGCGCLLWQ